MAAEPFGCGMAWATSPQSQQRCQAEQFNRKKDSPPVSPGFPRPFHHDKNRVGYVSGEFPGACHCSADGRRARNMSTGNTSIYSASTMDGTTTAKPASASRAGGTSHRPDPGCQRFPAPPRWCGTAEIDILVNLNGYFGGDRTLPCSRSASRSTSNKLSRLSRNPGGGLFRIISSPTVMSFLRITGNSTPEKIAYLPDSYQANDRRKREIAPHIFTRAECGLPVARLCLLLFQQQLQNPARHLLRLDADPGKGRRQRAVAARR